MNTPSDLCHACAVTVRSATLVACLLAPLGVPAGPAPLQGDPVQGEVLYQKCESCHTFDDNDAGPKHRGVVGRRAGSVPGYGYSAALKASGITWDEATLDAWLKNPSALVPGTGMPYKVDDPQDRADLIAYLKKQK